jgi:predicted small secreted protein
MMKGLAILSIAIIVLSLQACNTLLSDHRLQGAGEEEASMEDDLAIDLERCTVFFVARTRATQQEHARLQFRSRRKLPKLRRGRVS